MTKILTEQWCEKKLPDGAYYILIDKYEQNEPKIEVGVCYNSNFAWWIVKEVLSPVPTYDQFSQLLKKIEELEKENTELVEDMQKIKQIEKLQKKLDIAIKALNVYKMDYYISEYGGRSVMPYPHIARNALKEIDMVGTSAKEEE